MYVQGRKKILQKNKPTESVIRDIKVCFCQTVICTSKIQSFNEFFFLPKGGLKSSDEIGDFQVICV